jgi:hypothetical protein
MQKLFAPTVSLLLLINLPHAAAEERESVQEVGHAFDRCLPKKFGDMDGKERLPDQDYLRINVDFRNDDTMSGVYVHLKDKNVSRFDQFNVEMSLTAKEPTTAEDSKEHWYSYWRGVLKSYPGVFMYGRGESLTGGWFHYREWLTEGAREKPLLATSCWHYNFEKERGYP